ncbi:zinc finger protein 287-like isoform X1 [Solea solea]|uniref:zinc finger protein 287-like isoform X1 n=1 Tax=Solea solea TaxID=90069 RepID=UPI00272DAF33|nr:zinc finger protein 287-like isoform X1 [Solea solea]
MKKMRDNLKGNRPRLPLSALRLLVSPVRLVSAAVWQTVEQKAVAHYGVLEEFVSMVTDLVPELLTTRQRAQLVLGLRARLILELCQCEDSAHSEVVQPHLDRMQTLIQACVKEAGTTNVDVPNSDFVDFVKDMLKDPETRDNFYETVFPEEFGPAFDEALCTLTSLLLCRLEKFLPLHTFQQVASMFGDVSSVLQDCMAPVSQGDELRIVLQYHKENSQLDHNDGSLDGACIISALKLHSVKTTVARRKHAQDAILDQVPSHTGTEVVPSSRTTQTNTDTIPQCRPVEIKLHKTNFAPGDIIESITRRLGTSPSTQLRPVRQNGGLKMKTLLLQEKGGLCEEDKQTSPCKWVVSVNEDPSISRNDSAETAPGADCSDDDSWSYYSDDDPSRRSSSSSDSWSYYSDAASSLASPGKTPTDSLSCSSNEDLSFNGPKTLSSSEINPGIPDTDFVERLKPYNAHCLLCKELINTSLKAHMKTHFPSENYTCPFCNKTFKLYMSLQRHLRGSCSDSTRQQIIVEKPKVAKNLYKCDKCQDAYYDDFSLARHKITHHELYCSVCRRVLRDAATLARHKASHTTFQCIRCEETFTVLTLLLRHCERVHRLSRPFKCIHCPKTFPRLRALILHEGRHTGHLPFQCAQCGSRFRSHTDLVYHERVHTRERPCLCPVCGKTYSQNSSLRRHLKVVHSEFRNEKKHSCSQCEKSFKEKESLKKHEQTVHLNEGSQKTHQQSSHLHEGSLKKHQRGSHVIRFPCQICGKLLSQSSVVRHKLIHTGERPYKCTVPRCDKNFRSGTEVKIHILLHHTSERPFKCNVCGKGFIRLGFLNEHTKIHSGEKTFVCPVCGKAFLKLYLMRAHKKKVHAFAKQ